MGKVNTYLHSLNAGQHDKTALPRVDLERLRLATEIQTNWMCKAVGPAFFRPGLEYLDSTASNALCRLKEFVFGASDAALLEFTDQAMRIRINDVVITRPAVTAVVADGTFSTGVGWTLAATAGAVSIVAGNVLQLVAAARGSRASARQTVTVNQIGTEHALRIVVARGPVSFRCGSTLGGDEYIAETSLSTGTHSLSFTPSTASFFIELYSVLRPVKLVDSIIVEAAGVMTLPTPWLAADMSLMRFAQSADVVFVSARGYQQRRIERRSNRSWSVVIYQVDDGPFTPDRTRNVKLKPSVSEGNGTLDSDGAFFTTNHIGALFKITSKNTGQTVTLAAADQYTDVIRVTGIAAADYNDRDWDWTAAGTWSGALAWYRSFDDEDTGFRAFRKATGSTTVAITANEGPTVNADDDDNSIVYYKLGFGDGSYTSGAASISVGYDGSGGAGICRVVAYNSPTQVTMEVLKPFRNIVFTDLWQEGEWSAAQIWPSAVAFSDGRLWWSGEDRVWGSISDAFESFDEEREGDSGPISRSIATGGINQTQWMMALQRLIFGTEGAISTAKSSSLDEPLTPTAITIKDSSTTGVAPIDPIKVDSRGMFVERAGTAILEVVLDGASGEYIATQISKLTTELFESGVRSIAIQRRPDTRIWIVMADGSCICCVYEPDQDVLAFIPIETDGSFESVAVLPALTQDRVYFSVARTINGSTVRYVEKMALDSEVKPTTLCKVMDAFVVATPVGAVVSGATHLIGETVVAWADGAPVPGTFVVDGSGSFTLPAPATSVVYGLKYRGRIKTARLAYGAENGTSMLQKKTVPEVGLILTNFVRDSIRIGDTFDDPYRPLYPLPQKANGSTAPAIVLSDVHDEEPFSIGGSWSLDSRVCIEVSSPGTCTILGTVLTVETNG